MLMVDQLIGFAVGGDSAATATFLASTVDTANATNYTFSSQTLRASMVVAITRSGAATQGVSSVTVGGVSATLGVGNVSANGEGYCGLFHVSGVTPGTGDIVVNGSSAANRCGIATWETTGRSATPHHTASDPYSAGDADPSVSLNIPASGFAIAAVHAAGGVGSESVTWTNLTERYDATIESAGNVQSGASDDFTAAETGRTITANRSDDTNQYGALVALSFGP